MRCHRRWASGSRDTFGTSRPLVNAVVPVYLRGVPGPVAATAAWRDVGPTWCTYDGTDPGGRRGVTGSIGIIGGSGPLGRGLAGRFAQLGLDVAIGSRDRRRAIEAADKVRSRLTAAGETARGELGGGLNAEVADRDVVVVTLPVAALEDTLPGCAAALADRVVVSTVNPLAFDDGPYPVRLAAGSAAETVARLVPNARVTAAFHSVSSRHLLRYAEPLDDDVPVVGDDDEAVDLVVTLIDRIPGLRGLAAGPLRLAAPIEDLTAVLLSVNSRYGANAGLRLSRLPEAPPGREP